MNNQATTKDNRLYESELMKRILEVRYTDLGEEERLCKELLGIAEPKQDTYSCAFAHVYLADSLLAQRDFGSFNFHLIRARMLCQKMGYDDLMLALCNFAGLYYYALNDEQTAIEYYIEGLHLSETLNDMDTRGKLYNNIGIAFGNRGDWSMAKEYFLKAVELIESYANKSGVLTSYLSNLAEMCRALGDREGMREALLKCEKTAGDSLYQKIRLGTAWGSYYVMLGDKKRCIEKIEQLLEMGMLEFENQFFVCDMLEGICEDMMFLGEREWAHKFIEILSDMEDEAPIANQYRIELLKIKYWEQVQETALLKEALARYYEIVIQMSELEEKTRVQSMISKIEIARVQLDQEAMRSENKELERISQLDELTGLFNRRYLNKLITKTMQRQDIHSLGYIMLDVDYFKQYNDFYGHFKGDRALKAVADVIAESAGEGIFAGRYGGDEFVCLCVNLTDEEVAEYVGKVRSKLQKKNINHEKSVCCSRLTLSIGYSNRKVNATTDPEIVLDLADRALYEVKRSGRNGIAKK